jgi:hypothetical protein
MGWDVKFGTGGWQGYPGGLEAYARVHDFVELNASYYAVPGRTAAEKWRRSVPEAFEFAAVLPRRVDDWRAFDRVLEILRVRYVVVHPTTGEREDAVRRILEGGRVPVLETRTGPWAVAGIPGPLVTTDPADGGRPGPPAGAPAHYLRVFGAGHGVLHHLGAGMARRVADAVGEISGRNTPGGHVRVVVHTYSMNADIQRIAWASGFPRTPEPQERAPAGRAGTLRQEPVRS